MAEGPSPLLALPDELWLDIIDFLPIEAVIHLSFTSQDFCRLANWNNLPQGRELNRLARRVRNMSAEDAAELERALSKAPSLWWATYTKNSSRWLEEQMIEGLHAAGDDPRAFKLWGVAIGLAVLLMAVAARQE